MQHLLPKLKISAALKNKGKRNSRSFNYLLKRILSVTSLEYESRCDKISLNLVKDANNNSFINLHEFKKCSESDIFVYGKFVSKPFCLFVDECEMADKKIYIDEIPLQVTIYGAEYHFLSVTVIVNRNQFFS